MLRSGFDRRKSFASDEKGDMADLTKAEILGKLLKLLQTNRDLNFLMSLHENELTELLIAVRERTEGAR